MKTPTIPQGRIIKMSERLKRTRNAVPRIMKVLDTWPDALATMADDRIGINETYVLLVPTELMEDHGIPDIKAAARPIKKFVKAVYKSKYVVEALNTAEGPTIYISRPKPKR
jgi:hypothetical protein